MRSKTRTTIKIRKYESTVLRRSFVTNPDEEAESASEAGSDEIAGDIRQIEPPESSVRMKIEGEE